MLKKFTVNPRAGLDHLKCYAIKSDKNIPQIFNGEIDNSLHVSILKFMKLLYPVNRL